MVDLETVVLAETEAEIVKECRFEADLVLDHVTIIAEDAAAFQEVSQEISSQEVAHIALPDRNRRLLHRKVTTDQEEEMIPVMLVIDLTPLGERATLIAAEVPVTVLPTAVGVEVRKEVVVFVVAATKVP